MSTLRERINEIMFATCPVDTEEPFFWKWNDHGLEMLCSAIESEIANARKEMKEECLKIVSERTDAFDRDFNNTIDNLSLIDEQKRIYSAIQSLN